MSKRRSFIFLWAITVVALICFSSKTVFAGKCYVDFLTNTDEGEEQYDELIEEESLDQYALIGQFKQGTSKHTTLLLLPYRYEDEDKKKVYDSCSDVDLTIKTKYGCQEIGGRPYPFVQATSEGYSDTLNSLINELNDGSCDVELSSGKKLARIIFNFSTKVMVHDKIELPLHSTVDEIWFNWCVKDDTPLAQKGFLSVSSCPLVNNVEFVIPKNDQEILDSLKAGNGIFVLKGDNYRISKVDLNYSPTSAFYIEGDDNLITDSSIDGFEGAGFTIDGTGNKIYDNKIYFNEKNVKIKSGVNSIVGNHFNTFSKDAYFIDNTEIEAETPKIDVNAVKGVSCENDSCNNVDVIVANGEEREVSQAVSMCPEYQDSDEKCKIGLSKEDVENNFCSISDGENPKCYLISVEFDSSDQRRVDVYDYYYRSAHATERGKSLMGWARTKAGFPKKKMQLIVKYDYQDVEEDTTHKHTFAVTSTKLLTSVDDENSMPGYLQELGKTGNFSNLISIKKEYESEVSDDESPFSPGVWQHFNQQILPESVLSVGLVDEDVLYGALTHGFKPYFDPSWFDYLDPEDSPTEEECPEGKTMGPDGICVDGNDDVDFNDNTGGFNSGGGDVDDDIDEEDITEGDITNEINSCDDFDSGYGSCDDGFYPTSSVEEKKGGCSLTGSGSPKDILPFLLILLLLALYRKREKA